MNNKITQCIALAIVVIAFSSCSARKDYPGVEYAPQMYHSVPYEPLSQITEDGLPSDIFSQIYFEGETNSLPVEFTKVKSEINSKKPVQGTVKRMKSQVYAELEGEKSAIMVYGYHKDSLEQASKEINPLKVSGYDSAALVKEGKHLYISFCSPCHGENGKGNGSVGEVYKGVPNYAQGRYATMTEGHIFHVITHGKGRMWAHKSQLNPEERWKVVMYVQELQKG